MEETNTITKSLRRFIKIARHPGRRGFYPEHRIKCPLCGWRPPCGEYGGVRWKMMSQHLAKDILLAL